MDTYFLTLRILTLSIEQIISFGIRLSDGKPFIAITGQQLIFPLLGDYQTIKRDCLATGLFNEATEKVKHFHREAFIRIPHE